MYIYIYIYARSSHVDRVAGLPDDPDFLHFSFSFLFAGLLSRATVRAPPVVLPRDDDDDDDDDFISSVPL